MAYVGSLFDEESTPQFPPLISQSAPFHSLAYASDVDVITL